jgi:hypothetical protein
MVAFIFSFFLGMWRGSSGQEGGQKLLATAFGVSLYEYEKIGDIT